MRSEAADKCHFFPQPEDHVDLYSRLCPWDRSAGCVQHSRGVEWEQKSRPRPTRQAQGLSPGTGLHLLEGGGHLSHSPKVPLGGWWPCFVKGDAGP